MLVSEVNDGIERYDGLNLMTLAAVPSDTSFSSSSIDDGDGQFIVVRKGRRRKHRQQEQPNCGRKDRSLVNLKEDEVPLEKIDRIMERACSSSELALYSQQIINLLLVSLAGRTLSAIWAIGIGHFCRPYYFGRDQLAVLLKIKEYFGCKVYFQEPCSTEQEKQWLYNHGIYLSESNDFECRIADSNVKNAVLFYAPHCDRAIYNSLIYAHRKKLKRIIIVGNDIHALLCNMDSAVNCLEKDAEFVENPEKCGQNWERSEHSSKASENVDFSELQALSAYSKACTILKFPRLSSNFAAFNDTAVHYMSGNVAKPKIREERPVYQRFRYEIIM